MRGRYGCESESGGGVEEGWGEGKSRRERERECGRDISRFRLCCCGLRCRFAIMQSDSGRNSRRKERKKSGRGKKEVVEGLGKNRITQHIDDGSRRPLS